MMLQALRTYTRGRVGPTALALAHVSPGSDMGSAQVPSGKQMSVGGAQLPQLPPQASGPQDLPSQSGKQRASTFSLKLPPAWSGAAGAPSTMMKTVSPSVSSRWA